MKNFFLVYNPVSGHATFKQRLDLIIKKFLQHGILLTLYRTNAKDNSALIGCLKNSAAEGIIVAGGDGTLHEVINLLKNFSLDLPIGVIGSGTSNDFANHLQLDLEKTLDAISNTRIRLVDLGLINGKEFFINVACAGVLTSIAHTVNSRLKKFLGKGAYYIHFLSELKNFHAEVFNINADGKIFSIEAFLFLVINSSSVAGFKKVFDDTQINDGKLDLIAIKKCSPFGIINLMKKILSQKSITNDENIFHIQAKNFEINSSNSLISDIDGELGYPLPLKIETIHHALKIFC